MTHKTNYYATICRKKDIRIVNGAAAVLRTNTCCLPVLEDDNQKLYVRLEVATRTLSAFPSDLVIADVYVGCHKPTRVITREDTIHDVIGGAVIHQAAEEDVLTVSEFMEGARS